VTDYRFVANLRSETAKPEVRDPLHAWAYLLALDYATRGIRQIVPDLRRQRKKLFVDNGNFPLIEKVAKEFESRASPLLSQVATTERRQLRRRVRQGTDLSQHLRRRLTNLADSVAARVLEEAGEGDRQLDKQLRLGGTHLIGVENPTLATLIRLNLEPEYLLYSRADYRRLNRQVAEHALRRLEQVPAPEHYYPVASAVSYATAYDAGKVFANKGLENAAMGFGAFVSDRNDTDFVDIAGRRTVFAAPLPNRYVRAGAVARGFWDGYRDAAGRPPRAFHFLGLGAQSWSASPRYTRGARNSSPMTRLAQSRTRSPARSTRANRHS
jgi:hypothetical protein